MREPTTFLLFTNGKTSNPTERKIGTSSLQPSNSECYLNKTSFLHVNAHITDIPHQQGYSLACAYEYSHLFPLFHRCYIPSSLFLKPPTFPNMKNTNTCSKQLLFISSFRNFCCYLTNPCPTPPSSEE